MTFTLLYISFIDPFRCSRIRSERDFKIFSLEVILGEFSYVISQASFGLIGIEFIVEIVFNDVDPITN